MIDLTHAFDVDIELDPPLEFGDAPLGRRRIINIIGGTVSGPKLSGKVLRGGADWQLVRRDGTAYLEARYTVEAADGALIYVQNAGYRHGPPEVLARIAAGETVDPNDYYMRTLLTMETAAGAHDWMNRAVFVCTGERLAASVALHVYEVL